MQSHCSSIFLFGSNSQNAGHKDVHSRRMSVDNSIISKSRRIPSNYTDIDFTLARYKKRKLDNIIDGKDEQPRDDPKVPERGKAPTDSKLQLLLENLSCGGTKPSISSLVSKFSDSYVTMCQNPCLLLSTAFEFTKGAKLLTNELRTSNC